MKQTATIHKLPRPPITLAQFITSLERIETAISWLLGKQIAILGFRCTRRGPCITVAPHPAIWSAARGAAERRSYRQIGALRHELWAFTTREGVDVLWEEVVCAQ